MSRPPSRTRQQSTIYEDRVVCFLDILGFAESIRSTLGTSGAEDRDRTRQLRDALLSVRDVLDVGKKHFSKSKRVTQFSDSIVISFKIEESSEVFLTLLSMKWLILRLVSRKLVVRGGMAFGKLCHTDKLLFGPALVEAYELESRVAKVPRIAVSRAVIEKGALHHAGHHDPRTEEEYIRSLLKQDRDKRYYVDYFLGAASELDDEYDFPIYMHHLRAIIEAGLMAVDGDVRKKYDWMRRKYNFAARNCRSHLFLGSLEDSDIYDSYSQVRSIPKRSRARRRP